MRLKAFLLALSLTIPAFLYTNCTVPATDSLEEMSSAALKGEFAYDARADQIAYMSCDLSPDVDERTYWNFRVGAYRTGGLRIKPNFFENLPDSRFNTEQERIDYVSTSAKSTNSKLQVSIIGDLQRQWTVAYDGTAYNGREFHQFFPQLGVPELTQSLYKNYSVANDADARLRYLRNNRPWGEHFEGTIRVSTDYSSAEYVRRGFTTPLPAAGTFLLALTYSNGLSSSFSARSPYDFLEQGVAPPAGKSREKNVYGRGFRMSFGIPSGSAQAQYMVMSNVREESLLEDGSESPADTAIVQWSCPASYQLQIVQADDNTASANALCPIHTDDFSSANAYANDLKIIRNSLRVEDWYVHLSATKKCVVPKYNGGTSTCYGPKSAGATKRIVEYDLSKACRFDGGNVATNPDCSHFVSICVRP
jgi:hypothetical protein